MGEGEGEGEIRLGSTITKLSPIPGKESGLAAANVAWETPRMLISPGEEDEDEPASSRRPAPLDAARARAAMESMRQPVGTNDGCILAIASLKAARPSIVGGRIGLPALPHARSLPSSQSRPAVAPMAVALTVSPAGLRKRGKLALLTMLFQTLAAPRGTPNPPLPLVVVDPLASCRASASRLLLRIIIIPSPLPGARVTEALLERDARAVVLPVLPVSSHKAAMGKPASTRKDRVTPAPEPEPVPVLPALEGMVTGISKGSGWVRCTPISPVVSLPAASGFASNKSSTSSAVLAEERKAQSREATANASCCSLSGSRGLASALSLAEYRKVEPVLLPPPPLALALVPREMLAAAAAKRVATQGRAAVKPRKAKAE